MDKLKLHKDGYCDDVTCEECCTHEEHDHGICLYCAKDITDDLIVAAEYYYEGDR